MIIKKFLDKVNINSYTIILIFLAFLCGLFKEITVMLIIILIHEFGHFIMFNHYKWVVKKINIYPFGGITFIDDNIDKPLKEEFIISVSGLIFQEILFLIVFILFKNNLLNTYIYKLFYNYNISIFLFNLLPIIPLDGSKIMNVILNKIFNFRVSFLINIGISLVILFIFVFFFKDDSSYYLIIVFLMYQLYYNFKNRYILYNRFILEKKLRKSPYIKYKKVNNVKNMYRNKKNLIKKNNVYYTEYRFINKK